MPPHLIAFHFLRALRPPATCRLLLSLLIFIVAPLAIAQTQTPPDYKPQGYVNDFANVLSSSTHEQLTALCKEVDEKAHAQIAVVTVPTTNGQPIIDYSFNLATKWGVGPKQSNRGVMILFAVNDHKYWIQVGYGLEPILPDGKVGGFGREAVPILRQGNYEAAVLVVTRRVADVIAKDAGVTVTGARAQAPAEPQVQPRRGMSPGGLVVLAIIILLVLFTPLRNVLFWFLLFGGGGRGGYGGGGGFGGGGGGFGGFGGGSSGGGGASGSW